MSEETDGDEKDSEYTRISIRIKSDEKEKWRKSIEDLRLVDNLTDLIKVSVQKYIESDSDTTKQTEITLDSDITELDERLTAIENELQDIKTTTSYTVDLLGEESIHDRVSSEIYEVLPTFSNHREARKTIKNANIDWNTVEGERASKYGYIEDIITVFSSYGRKHIIDGIDYLVNESSANIQQITIDSNRFIFEIEER